MIRRRSQSSGWQQTGWLSLDILHSADIRFRRHRTRITSSLALMGTGTHFRAFTRIIHASGMEALAVTILPLSRDSMTIPPCWAEHRAELPAATERLSVMGATIFG